MITDLWAYQNGVKIDFSRPGKPTDNAYIETFNGTLRAECLDTHWFRTLAEAKESIEAWRQEYNESRPHRALGERTPNEFANEIAASRDFIGHQTAENSPESWHKKAGPITPFVNSHPSRYNKSTHMFENLTERKRQERLMRDAGRLPPNQALTLKWPVLHVGDVPRFNPQTWDFKISGLVEERVRLTWDQFTSLPMTQVTADMHCVTRWSRFDVRWEGVLFSDLVKRIRVRPGATHVMVEAEHGYTSNVPLADLLRPTTLFALKHNREPLSTDHGYPLRLVVPNLYAWKSVKWVRGLEFLDHDEPGFWEQNGYNGYGDPFKEERFSG